MRELTEAGAMDFKHAIMWILLVSGAVRCQFNPPTIPGTMPVYFTVLENSTIGTEVFLLRANDQNIAVTLTFSTSTPDTTTLVRLGPTIRNDSLGLWTCKVFLNAALDRDRSPSSRDLYFSVTDGQSVVQIRIVMIIQDVNDNPPTFVGLPYRQSIPENLPVGSSVFTVTATDPDINNGPYIFYSMKSTATDYDQIFDLNITTGRITLAKPLDYETQSFFNFNVSAKDSGDPPCPGETCQCSGTPDVCNPGPAELFITIIDVQDTPPIFERLPYIKSVPENEPIGFSILKVVATDGDRGISEPNDVRYSFTGEDFYNFSINEFDGTISVGGTLDADVDEIRSKGGLFVFTVTATEVPRPGFPSTPNSNNQSSTQVSITVTDVNDNPPVFLSNGLAFSDFTANVLENTPGGVPVTASSIIEVYDRDQGSNSRFWVYLEKDGSPYHDFQLLPQQHSLIQGRSTVTITVANSSALDYETTQNITFKLIARENNSNANIPTSSEITVTININDTNDNSPYFPEQPTVFNVTENEDIGHVITTVTASDLDSGKFGEINFSLEDGGENGDFNISKQGQITVAKWLDREITPFYSLIVVAEDNPPGPADQRRSTRRFQIRVLDDNDNAPVWQQDKQYIRVLETTDVGTNLTEMRATDADQGINAEIVYSIAPGTNGSNLFEAITNGAVAVIKIKQSLIDNTGLQLVHVVATDKGTPSKSSMMNLYIIVDDVNQHKPVFICPNESSSEIPQITIKEEQEPESVLYTLLATDNDKGENGQVLYFMNLPLRDYFRVNSTNGELYSRQRLDRESKDTFEIQVKAEDNGKPVSLSTIITLRIRLEDINDNEPSYKNVPMPQVLHVTEERQPEYIGQIEPAFDPDLDPYNRSCYYFHGSKNISGFHLDKMTGNLTLIKKVDREVTESVNLVIKASENCSQDSFFFINDQNSSLVPVPALLQDLPVDYNSSDYSLLWVQIMVDDINDNPPQFTVHELLASIIYDVDIDTEVMSLAMSISDKDTPANSKNKFKSLSITPVLESGEGLDTTKEPFLVSENGSITTNIRFRSDLLGYFLLKVLAYDDDGLNDTAEIKVYLIANLQRIKLVFNKLPNQVEEMKNSFVEQLSNILNVDLIIDKIQSHTSLDGTRDPSKTDAFIHGRYRSTGKIVPASDLWQMFDVNQAARTFMLSNGVIAAQPLTEQKTDNRAEEERKIFAIIIAVLSIVAIALVLVLIHMVRLYRRRLRAATTMAYVAPNEKAMFDHPGTNKYFAAENPLFGKEMKQSPMNDDDKISTNSLDVNEVDKQPIKSIDPNEEQEMVMNIVDSNGEDQTQNLNHYSHLDEVLQAYSNMAYENDENEDSYSTAIRGAAGQNMNKRSYSSSPYTLSFVSGIRPNAPESVTRFTDEVISNDSGLADTNLRHTDI